MAAYSRTQLLLLLLSLLGLCGFGSVLGSKAASGPAEPPNPPVIRAADPPAKDAPAAAAAAAAAAGASQPRRATGWKLSEEEACREDLTRLCPKHTWTNNLAVLECLQDRREVSDPRRGWKGSAPVLGCDGDVLGVSPRSFGPTPAVSVILMEGRTSAPAPASTHTHTQQVHSRQIFIFSAPRATIIFTTKTCVKYLHYAILQRSNF